MTGIDTPDTKPALSRRSLIAGAASVAGLAVTGGLAGCSGGQGLPGDNPGGGSTGGPVTLQWWTNHTAFDEKLFKQAIDRYKKVTPDVTVKLLNIADGPQYYTKIKTAAVGKKLPDVFYARTYDTAANAAKGWQLPIDDYLKNDPQGLNTKDFWPAELKQMSYQDKVYSLPYNLSDFAVYVNKNHFAELGIDLPTDDWTWDQFFDLAKSFVKQGAKRQARWGCSWPFFDWYMMGMLKSNGGATFSDDLKSCVVNNPENVSTLDTLQTQMKAGVAPIANALPAGVNPFAAGLITMNVDGSWGTGATRDAVGKKFDWEVYKLPKGSTGKRECSTAGGAWGISAFTPNKDAAWKFAAFLTAPEQQNLLIGDQGSVPGLQSATDQWLADAKKKTPPTRMEVFTEQLGPDAVNWTYPAFWSEFETIWNNRISGFTNGKNSAADTLKAIQDDTNKAAGRYQ